MFRSLLFGHFPGGRLGLGLLFLRVVAGAGMLQHGWGKIQSPFGWMGPDSTMPGILQAAAALAEFGGGICWVLGLLTPVASVMIGGTMAVAVHFHAVILGDVHVASGPGQGSFEPALLYFAVAVLFLLAGPGWFSADRFVFGRNKD